MVTHLTNRFQSCSAKTAAKKKKPGKYFTLKRTLLYFPTHNAVPSKRVNIAYEDKLKDVKLISFDPAKNGKLCITKSGSRAHIGLHSRELKTMAKRMPWGAYVPMKWSDVPASFKTANGVTKNHRVFKFDPDLSQQLSTTASRSAVSIRKCKRRKSSKKKRLTKKGINISRSLKAFHRGRKSASRKR